MVQIQLTNEMLLCVKKISLNPTWFRYNREANRKSNNEDKFKSHMVQIQLIAIKKRIQQIVSLNPTWFRYNPRTNLFTTANTTV